MSLARISSGLGRAAAGGALLALTSSAASAQMMMGTGNSIGEKLQFALSTSSGAIFAAIAGLAWTAGLYLFFSGLARLAKAGSDGGQGDHAASGLIRLVMGIMLFAMPDLAGIGMQSLFGIGAFDLFGNASQLAMVSQQLDLEADYGAGAMAAGQMTMTGPLGTVQIQPPQDCYSAGTGVTCMAGNIARNAVPIGIFAIYAICFLAGLAMFASSLWTVSKTVGQGGHHQGLPPGFWAKLAVSLLLVNAPLLIMMAATSLQGQGGVLTINGFDANSSFLSYNFQPTGGTSTAFAQNLQQFQQLIGYVFTILALFGVWAFFKGVFMVKATSEGKSNHTMGGGFVFIVGGVLLANAKISTCMIMYTFGGQGLTFGFCS